MSENQKIRSGSPQFARGKLNDPDFLSSLIHKVGHEIGNPLTSIISLATIIERFSGSNAAATLEPEKITAYAKSIIKEAWRISSISEKLVLLLSQKAGCPSLCDAGAAVDRTLSKLKSRGGFDTSDVIVELQAGEPPLVYIDPDQLLVMLSELLANAVENDSLTSKDSAAEQVPSIVIDIRSRGNETEISVTNKLSAPCPFALSTLFEPFVTAYEEQKHLGLGLTTAAVIVQRFHGSIGLTETKKGEDYFFETRVKLPAHTRAKERTEELPGTVGGESQETGHAGSPSVKNGENSTKPLVAIVEDDLTVASAITKILGIAFADEGGIACITCSGEEAVQRIKSGDSFDVMLCDLHLEKMSGRHIFNCLIEARPKELNKFAFLTGERGRPETQLYLKTTKRPYLFKPFEPDELIAVVRKLLADSSSNIKE